MSAINRIVIVGNGFDLAHNLETRYSNFIDWYWDKWFNKLKFCELNTYTDNYNFYSFKDKGYNWKDHWALNLKGQKNPWDVKGREFYDFIKQHKNFYTIKLSPFMENICESIETKGWVDIEYEYYKVLNNECLDKPENLNNELQTITNYLIEYLKRIQDSINDKIINNNLKRKILAPIKANEVAISSRSYLIDLICFRIKFNNVRYSEDELITIGDNIEYNKNTNNITHITNFINSIKNQISNKDYSVIKNAISNNKIPDDILYPNKLMLLNFNYTNTADLYIPTDERYKHLFYINHIHGDLSNSKSIIFGYGDELDDNYKKIVKLNNNEHLKNIKSIKYLEEDNYRKILEFIESAPYQIYIMGHSCGNSDRTLLNTLFEHKNCISIKPFYYVKENGENNYLDLIQNISRNFTDMKLMRDRVVNKLFCEPII